jgi:WD40 repeat protein
LPSRVGDYDIEKEIARGGMGVIFQARQKSLQRTVALKMILAGQLASDADRQRFRTEAEAAAQLDHPNIVPIYDVGEHEGVPYFSMKLIEGGPIADFGKQTTWPSERARERWIAQVLAQVAHAVHYAHQRGILHRDLKPANILIGFPEASASGPRDPESAIPYVTDFGLAKRTGAGGSATQTGAVVGTPSYMAPEQAGGQKTITTAADVYALGTILYDLLTGQPPFKADNVMQTLSDVLHLEPTPPRRLVPQLDDDLQTICLKCLEKEPAARYASAADLARDLQRWLAGEPIRAQPAGWWKHTVKWIRRRPTSAALLAVSTLSLVGLLVLLGVLLDNAEKRAAAVQDLETARLQANKIREDAKLQKEKSDRDLATVKTAADLIGLQKLQSEEDLTDARNEADKVRAEARDQKERLGEAQQKLNGLNQLIEWNGYANDMRTAKTDWERANPRGMVALLEKHRPRADAPDLRGFEWYYLWRQSHLHEREWFAEPQIDLSKHNPGAEVLRFALSPDGKTVATLGRDKSVKLWDVASGKLERKVTTLEGWTISFSFAGDSTLQVLTIKPSKLNPAKFEKTPPGPQPVLEYLALKRFDLDDPAKLQSQKLEAPAAPSTTNLFDMAVLMSGANLWGITGPNKQLTIITALAWSPDGSTLAMSGMTSKVSDKGIKSAAALLLWDIQKQEFRTSIEIPDLFMQAVAFSPGGDMLVTAGVGDRAVTVRDPHSGKEKYHLKGHNSIVSHVGFSRDGKQVITGSVDGVIRIWEGPKAVLSVQSGLNYPTLAQFTPDGKEFVVGSAEGGIRVWKTEALRGPPKLTGVPGAVTAIELHNDGTLTTVDQSSVVQKMNAATGKVVAHFRPGAGFGRVMAVSPNGEVVAMDDFADKGIRLVEMSSGKPITLPADLPQANKMQGTQAITIARDGKKLAFARGDLKQLLGVVVVDLAGGKTQVLSTAASGRCGRLLFAPDGRQLYAAVGNNLVAWNLEAGQATTLLQGDSTVLYIAVSSQGDLLACCTAGGVVLLDAKTGKTRLSLRSDGHTPSVAAFSPDGRRLATGGNLDEFGRGGGVRLWDLASGLEVMTLGDPERPYTALTFSADGRTFAVASVAQMLFFSGQETEGDVVLLEAATK